MTLQQLQQLKQWHLNHHGRSVELVVCDLVLGAWVGGWALLAELIVIGELWLLPISLALTMAPMLYVTLRRHLHRQGRLRCDWLAAVQNR